MFASDTEIEHLDLFDFAMLQKQITRLHIAMNDALRMRYGQRFCHV